MFKIKETSARESSASDIIYSENASNDSAQNKSPSPLDQNNILEATRSKSVKNLLKRKSTFKMPSAKLSF